MAKGTSCECGSCMGNTCKTITGLLVLAAGAAFLAFGLGMVAVMTAHMVSGAALLLAGLSFTVHGLKMCPMCK